MPMGRGSWSVPALTSITGVCAIAGGAFPTDPLPGYPPGEGGHEVATLTGTIHNLNIVPFHLAITAAAMVMAQRLFTEPGRRAWAWSCVATAVLAPATIMVTLALADSGFHGLWQRINLTISLGWFAAMAWRLLRALPRTA